MRQLSLIHKAVIALIFANIIWGFAPAIFKLSLENLPVFTLAFLRFYLAAIILLPFCYKNIFINKKDIKMLFITGFSGIFISILCFLFGLKYSPAINASIIASSAPIFLYAYSIIWLKEKQHPKILVGMIICLFGVLLIIGQPLFNSFHLSEIFGNLLFVIATLANLIHSILSKKLTAIYQPIVITYWSFLIGSLFFLPFFVWEFISLNPFSTIDYRGILGLLFGIFLSSALAYFLFEWGIKKIDIQEIGIFSYIDPIAGTLAAVIILSEKITPVFVIGSFLVFFGIFIAEDRLHYHPLHKLKR